MHPSPHIINLFFKVSATKINVLAHNRECRLVFVLNDEKERDNSQAPNEYDRFTIRTLTETTPPLETIDSNVPIQVTLRKMHNKRYSQLPVLKGETCIGSVTFESILRIIADQAAKSKLGQNFMEWPTERFVDRKIKYVSPDDDLVDHVEWMAKEGFVLVSSPQRIDSILTNYDLVLFFKRKTEAFLLLREIETSLRYVVSHNLNARELKEAIASIATENGFQVSGIYELTFNDLRQVILSAWGILEKVFVDREKTSKQLESIRILRNQILHFRGRLLASHLAQLRRLRDYYVSLAVSLT